MEVTEENVAKNGGKDEAKPVTRAAKAKRQKEILRALLEKKPYKWNELLEEAVKEYTAKYPEENADIPDIKGKFGSNFSLMEDAGEVLFDKAANMCSLKIEEPKKRGRKSAAKAESKAENKAGKAAGKIAEAVQEKEEEKRAAIEESLKKAVEKAVAKAEAAGKKRVKKSAAKTVDQPIAEVAEEKPQPKKRGRKPSAKTEVKAETKAEVKAEVKAETAAPATETKTEEKPIEKPTEKPIEKPIEKPVEAATTPAKQDISAEEKTAVKAAPAPAKNDTKKDVKKDLWLSDFVFLGNASSAKKEEPKSAVKSEPKAEVTQAEKPAEERKIEPKIEPKIEQKTEQKTEPKPQRAAQPRAAQARTAQAQPQTQVRAATQTRPAQARSAQTRPAQSQSSPRTADEKLKEEFLKRLRALSGEYFEYYSVYLLERYSLKSGRRLEGLRVSGGKDDGGIDGEIELTDRFGFRETIYIQAKNWDPTKGLADKWMIGETLVQQFVGAATCRQMRDSKRNCRGIFVTTSTFTKDAKDALEVLGEKFIGYDGNDVFETAKECEFGLVKVNGVWQLDEKLLASDKAFFSMC